LFVGWADRQHTLVLHHPGKVFGRELIFEVRKDARTASVERVGI